MSNIGQDEAGLVIGRISPMSVVIVTELSAISRLNKHVSHDQATKYVIAVPVKANA